MKLRRLTDAGVAAFADYLDRLKAEPTLEPPISLLTDPAASADVTPEIEVEPRRFKDRLDLAAYLFGLLKDLVGVDRDRGVWTWLTLYHFDQLCPKHAKTGHRKPAVQETYVPDLSNNRRFYRHLLYGPFAIYRMYATRSHVLPVLLHFNLTNATSETYRPFIETNEILSCYPAVELAYRLYFDPAKGSMKRGFGSKEDGGCRRLIDYLRQITLTYDLHSLSEGQMRSMLPKEFRSFLLEPSTAVA